jgi:phosphopantetheinyl transferase (holo-ACP synthase)/malonyl CoA-acyl carrier protein transacylase
VFTGLPVGTPDTEVWSCTTAAPYPADEAGIRELLVEHWTSPVRFRETIEALYEQGGRVFVECGPRGNMTAFVEDILRGKPSVAVASDLMRRSGTTQLNHLVAQLAAHGVDVQIGHLFADREAREVDWRAAEAPAKARPRVPLNMKWPAMAFSDEVVERVRARSGAAPAPAGTAAANGHAHANGNGNGHANGAAHANGNGHANGRSAAPAPAGIAAAPVPAALAPAAPAPAPAMPVAAPADGEASALVENHLRLMEQFLQAGEQVMTALLQPAPAPAAYPLLGQVVASEPDGEVVWQRVVDPARDRLLCDHTLGTTVSVADPSLTGLPLMPLALSLEVVAEAGHALVGEGVVTGLRDVRAHRWVAFGEEPRTLEVRARRLQAAEGAERVRVVLRDEPGATPCVEATVLVAPGHAPAPAPLEVSLDGGRPGRWAPGQCYGEAMFHGPSWQGVEFVASVAPAAALARMRVLPMDPGFLLDPITLDAAGQVIGFWAAEQFERGRVVFPFRLEALDVHGPRRPAGEELTCVAAVRTLGEHLMSSDIDVLDGAGQVWLRLRSWDDKRFDVPDRFRPLTEPSERLGLSQPWGAPAAVLGGGDAVAARAIDSRIPADAGLWGPAWARRVLSRAERAAFDALDRPEPRRLEWLGARTAAKEAVIDLLHARYGYALLPADVELVPDERGRPLVRIAGLEQLDVEPVVSLAHTAGIGAAVAALVPRGSGASVGFDFEAVRALPDGFADAALTAEERPLLAAVPAEQRDEWLIRCWSAKEAAGKAAGTGMAPEPVPPRVSGLDLPSGAVVVTARGIPLTVATIREGDMISATTTWPAQGGPA